MLWWTLQNLVIVTVLAGAVAVVCRLRRLTPAARHALWLVVLVFPYALLTVPPYTMFADQVGLPEQQYDPLPFFRLLTLPLGWGYRPTVLHLTIAYDVSIAAWVGQTSYDLWQTGRDNISPAVSG